MPDLIIWKYTLKSFFNFLTNASDCSGPIDVVFGVERLRIPSLSSWIISTARRLQGSEKNRTSYDTVVTPPAFGERPAICTS